LTTEFQQQGFNLMSFNKGDFSDLNQVRAALDYMVSCGANFVNVDWVVAFNDDGTRLPQTDPRSHESSQQDIAAVIALAHERGLAVSLKPHISYPDSYANRIESTSEIGTSFIPTMLAQWSAYIRQVATLAQSQHVEQVVIGTEMIGYDQANRSDWASMIAGVRAVYAGQLAYDSAQGADGFQQIVDRVVFWDLVDVIGLSLYLPLSHDDNASPAELNAAWLQNPFGYGNVVAYLQGLSTQYGKPIMLLESGFQSVQGGFEQHFTDGTHPVDNGVQAAGIASMLDVLGKYQGDWFKGLSIWSVFPPFMDLASAQNQWGYTTGFMTNGKPAAQTIADYFTGATTYSDPNFYGGIASGTIHGSYAADTIHAGVGAEIIFAGAGNDTILFSAGSPVPSAAHIVIQASGDVHDATGAKFQVYVDGRALGGVNEAKASQPFTFDLPLSSLSAVHTFSIVTVPDPLFANGINRAVHVSKIEVNGYALSQSDGNYEGGQIVGAGSWNQLYSGTTMVQNVSTHQDYFFGSPFNDDIVDGGEGIDTIVFGNSRNHYTLGISGDAILVQANGESARLSNVERLQFSDTSVAVDLDGHAGEVARLLGVVFGKDSIANKAYVGIGLQLADAGMGYEELAGLALQVRLGTGFGNQQEVMLLYRNLMGVDPSASELGYYGGLLDSASLTQQGLAVLAAKHPFNDSNINFAGLAQTGLEFS
jgi:hypothetical protein